MAHAPVFKSAGGIQVVKGRSYTSSDLPTVPVTPIDTIKISEAPLIWRKVYNQDGTIEKKDGKDKYVKGNQRGVWILIKRTTVTYGAGDDVNVPVLYKEEDEIALHADNTYTFLAPCRIEYGNV
ncbi:MAG: hypothetical protein GQ570_11745 [Helicobacteraceae bacterium]|nr:hypothetical protein [Helicobacteraceae bacterium]